MHRPTARGSVVVVAVFAGMGVHLDAGCAGGVGAGTVALAAGPVLVTIAVPHGNGYTRGRSTILVTAPMAKVRDTVLDFRSYPEFMPHYSKCKVLGRTASGGRNVYMEVSALHGALTMWARIEMAPAAVVGGVETHEATFVEGNVDDLKAVWRLKNVDDGTTELSLEVLMIPRLPIPKKLVNQENLDGSAAAVLAAKRRAEGRR